MPTLTEDEVRASLPAVIDAHRPGEEVVVTRGGKPVARLVADAPPKGVPVYGRGKGKVQLDLDDDGHLADFAEYMP
jgi:antitoxin (DNA-binding transcriptional repressor) of toxin-antitoxin stability system